MALLLIAFLATTPQQFGDPARDFLLTEKDAIMLGPAEAACASMADSYLWSPDGKFIAVKRTVINVAAMVKIAINPGIDPGADVQPVSELCLWQASTKTLKKVLSLPMREATLQQYGWIPGSATAFAVSSNKEGLQDLWVAAIGMAARKVLQAPSRFEIVASPAGPLVAVVQYPAAGAGEPLLSYMDGSGRLSNGVSLPARIGIFRWSADGSTLIARNFNKGSEGWYSVGRDGKITKIETPAPDGERELELTTGSFRGELGQKSIPESIKAPTAVLHATKLDPKDPSFAVIGTDAEKPALAPDLSAVAYISQGVLMVRPLMRVPKEAFLKAREAALRTEIINKAKQAGLALIMFAGDNDDNYPTQDGWQDKVMPYLKNADIISGFNYTYAGGPMSGIKEPANTIIGFMTGPGGRAITYADGHVKWEKNGA